MRLLAAALVVLLLAGCVTPPSSETLGASADLGLGLPQVIPVDVRGTLAFTQSVIGPAVGLTNDLYEPTMEVSDSGTIYVAGHVIGAATTGTPAYYSNDDGKTWKQLPFLGALSAPAPIQGAQPPPGDEGFIVAGADGQAWMADIYAAGFSITGWCDDGASQCYDNRQAYDRVESTTGCNPTLATVGPVPIEGSLNDRPWAAYANGTLLLVNNAGGGPMQLGVMPVPPDAPVGLVGLNGPQWTTCASEGGYIPGVPAMRGDGLFAVPQLAGDDLGNLTVVLGNAADITTTTVVPVFPVTHAGPSTSNYGFAAFDADGALYVAAMNNTLLAEGEPGDLLTGGGTPEELGEGRFVVAVSLDDGATFRNATFLATAPLESIYLDGNMAGPGALLVWSQRGDTEGRADWYVAHVLPDPDGAPTVSEATLAVDEGPRFAAHVMGAAAGPDGRAYFVHYEAKDRAEYAGSTPLSVWVQTEGARLPIR